MPKRSNEFQRLVKRIYDQLAPSGAKVTESASLPDYGELQGPEIDILIEFEIPGVGRIMRIAVECRDHKRRADKTWIDGVIGKYRDVAVDRVIAVSRSEFTRGARKKAKQGKIELLTLEQALETDWPRELMLIAVGRVEYHPEIGVVDFVADPPWPDGTEPVSVRIGEKLFDQGDFKRWLLQEIVRHFSAQVDRDKAEGSGKLGEIGKHSIVLSVESNVLTFRSALGTEHRVNQMTLHSSVTVTETMLPVTRYKFGDVGVSEAPAQIDGKPAVLVVVQERGKDPLIKLVPTR